MSFELMGKFNPNGRALPKNEAEVKAALSAVTAARSEQQHGGDASLAQITLVSFQAPVVTLKRSGMCASCAVSGGPPQTEDTVASGLRTIWRDLDVNFEDVPQASTASNKVGGAWQPPKMTLNGKG